MNYLLDKLKIDTEYGPRLRQPITPLLEESMFQPMTDEDLFTAFKQAARYKPEPWETKLSDIVDPYIPGTRYGTGQARVNYEKDDATAGGLDQIVKMGREMAGLGATKTAQLVAAPIAGAAGAIAGSGTWDKDFDEWYWKAFEKASELEQKLRGADPSYFMQALDKAVFKPATEELVAKTGDRKMAEKHINLLMSGLLMKGVLKPRGTGRSVITKDGVEIPEMSKTPNNIGKVLNATGAAVAAPLVLPYAKDALEKFATSPFDGTNIETKFQKIDNDSYSIQEEISKLSNEQLVGIVGAVAGVGEYTNSGKFLPAKNIPKDVAPFTDLSSKKVLAHIPAETPPVLRENWRDATTIPELLSDTKTLGTGQESLLRSATVDFNLKKGFSGQYDPETNRFSFPSNATTEDVLSVLPHESTHSSAAKWKFPQGTSPSAIDITKVSKLPKEILEKLLPNNLYKRLIGEDQHPLGPIQADKVRDIIYRNIAGEKLAYSGDLDAQVQRGELTPAEYRNAIVRDPYGVLDKPTLNIEDVVYDYAVPAKSVYTEQQQAYNSNIKAQEGRYVTQDDGIRPNGDAINGMADSTQQATVQGPSTSNNRTLQVRQPEEAQRWSTVNGKQVKPVSINTVDMQNPKPGVVLVHSSQVDGLDLWDPSKANPEYYTGKNTSGGFWGAPKEGAELHGADRPENVTGQYLIRAENPISTKYDGGPKTQAAMQAARAAGHDVAFLYDDLGNRNVVHLKPEEGGVKNIKNTGEWSESPSMLHSWALPVAAATASLLLGDDDQKKALGLAGTMAVIPKSQRINEIQAKIRAAATPAEKAELGRQLKAVMLEGKPEKGLRSIKTHPKHSASTSERR